IYTHPQRLIAD
ncbi:hypothetical protein AIM17_25790, partial [Salmonella enterica subsp. enterica serovar Newport]